jgi:hypothetical protein
MDPFNHKKLDIFFQSKKTNNFFITEEEGLYIVENNNIYKLHFQSSLVEIKTIQNVLCYVDHGTIQKEEIYSQLPFPNLSYSIEEYIYKWNKQPISFHIEYLNKELYQMYFVCDSFLEKEISFVLSQL